MIVQLGWRYKFAFKEPFDKLNGVYAVTKIYSFEELVQDRIDLQQIYDLVGSDTLAEDILVIRHEPIYKLVSTLDETVVLFIPQILVELEPDPTVEKYYNSVVTWNVGVYPDKEQLVESQRTVSEVIEKVFGTDKPPLIIDVGVVWLTKEEFKVIENERDLKRETAFNWFSENQRIRKENDSLRSKVSELEKIITAHIQNE